MEWDARRRACVADRMWSGRTATGTAVAGAGGADAAATLAACGSCDATATPALTMPSGIAPMFPIALIAAA